MFEEGTIADGPNGPIIFRGGTWVPLKGGQGGGQVFSLPQSPEKMRDTARQDADDARKAEKDRRDALEWAATHNPDGSPKPKTGDVSGKPLPDGAAKRYEEAINAFASLDRATGAFQDDFAGNTIIGGLENDAQSLISGIGTPGQAQWWSDFKSTDNILRNALFGASLTAGEKAAYEATSVSPSMDPAEVKANLTRRMDLARDVLSRRTNFLKANGYNAEAVDALAGEYGPMLSEPKASTQNPDQQDAPPLASPMANGGPPASPLTNMGDPYAERIASGPTRNVSSKIEKQIDAMMNAGASKAMIDTVLKQQGIPPISPEQYNAAKTWMKQNPGKSYYGAQSGQVEDMSLLQRAAGSEAGSLAANMADAFTAGTSTALAGDTGRAALAAMKAQNPNASLAGSLIGGVTGAGMAEAALLARAPAALAKYAPRIADAAYGGLTGFNAAEEGQGGTGALLGAGAGLAGGLVGEGVMRGAGAVARGVTDPAAQRLRELGIPMTVGQAMGGGVKKVEDALTSIPFVGNMIDRRRGEGLDAFNKAAFDIGAETTGGQVQDIGSDGIRQLAGLRSQAYDNALNPVRIDATDAQFLADRAAAEATARGIPQVGENAAGALDYRIAGGTDPNGGMTGRDFQEAYRGLARDGRAAATGPYANEFAGVMREGQDALAGALERQNPGAYQGFVDANTANRRLMVLADAVGKAENQGGRFMPSQLNRADSTSATRLTGKVASSGGDRPFAELAQAGQEVLPSKMADSGTFTRALVGLGATGGLGGAGYVAGGGEGGATGTGLGLGATLALALGGTKGAQSLAVRGLMDRPDLAVVIGEQLKRNARIGGAGGAGLGAYLGTMLAE